MWPHLKLKLLYSFIFCSFHRCNLCSKLDLHPPGSFLHPNRFHRARANELKTKNSGKSQTFPILNQCGVQINQKRIWFNVHITVNWESDVLSHQKYLLSFFCFSGCLLHCSRLHLYEHELDVHRTGLGLRRESKWRRSLIFNHKTVRVQKAFEEHHHPFLSPECERIQNIT